MDIRKVRRLKLLLREVQIMRDGSERLEPTFDEICNLVFTDNAFMEFWDEELLNGLRELFQLKSPSVSVYGEQLRFLADRREFVQTANDIFFSLLDSKSTSTDIVDRLSRLLGISHPNPSTAIDPSRIADIRVSTSSLSEKVRTFVDYLSTETPLVMGAVTNDLYRIAETMKAQETPGKVNAMLVTSDKVVGVLIPLSIRLSPGEGKTICLVSVADRFTAAIDRARRAMESKGFLACGQDVDCSLEITSAEYSGDSIALAAAVGIYSAASKECFDPFTAFTGNINLDGSIFKILPVSGINAKLSAAVKSGCRRVFLPAENRSDVGPEFHERLQILYVTDIIDVLLKLQLNPAPVSGESLQVRKLNFLRAYCQNRGWDLSEGEQIQDALQFTVSPAHPPEIKINLYYSGTHTPKTNDGEFFHDLLDGLQGLDQPKIATRDVNKTFLIKDVDLRRQIRERLEQMRPDSMIEQYCDYSFRFQSAGERLVAKQYAKGTLQLQGRAGDLYKRVLDVIIPPYNMKHPNAKLLIDEYLDDSAVVEAKASVKATGLVVRDILYPHIGTDESGKGDYFGPLVVAGVWVDEKTAEELEALGARDSKLLSDKRCKELAAKIREICQGKFEEIELVPERYNDLYDQFAKERKNLNHLLAWGHARAIESLAEKLPCDCAIADQFGDEKYILSKLMAKGKKLELIQTPKGERYVAVAAASILARDRFLSRMEKFNLKYGLLLPKGASDLVVSVARSIVGKTGPQELRNVAKLHHRTTQRVIERKQ